MNLPRIVDTEIPDHWAENTRMVRSALDCFAPLAITIRTKHGSPFQPVQQGQPDQRIRAQQVRAK